jgi:hypothetical protein
MPDRYTMYQWKFARWRSGRFRQQHAVQNLFIELYFVSRHIKPLLLVLSACPDCLDNAPIQRVALNVLNISLLSRMALPKLSLGMSQEARQEERSDGIEARKCQSVASPNIWRFAPKCRCYLFLFDSDETQANYRITTTGWRGGGRR